MTILNLKNVDTTLQPLFLGEELSLQRYDRFKYKVFFDLFRKQVTNFWTPEEINLNLDRVDYENLSDNEKRIFTKNLLFQTMLDSVVARGVPCFTQYISNPELEICCNTWGFFENIHSYSYTYIIKNVYPDPQHILDQALNDKEIVKRAEGVRQAYDLLNINITSDKDRKKQIYLSLISVNILEAIRFYVSFVCAFAFGENKKMMGNAEIIKLIRRDEALHLYNTQTILNILKNEPSEGFQEVIAENSDIAQKMFLDAAKEEKEWASYLFQYGSMMGLNEQILHQYIEWLTDSRMAELGFAKPFGTKNPIRGWIEPWMNSSAIQVAPQETEVTSYKISASKNDIGNEDFVTEL